MLQHQIVEIATGNHIIINAIMSYGKQESQRSTYLAAVIQAIKCGCYRN